MSEYKNNRDEVREEIRERWAEIMPFLTSPAKVKGQWICGVNGCQHGARGDGLRINPKAKSKYELKCFTCHWYGDVLSYYQAIKGVDFNTALEECANILNLRIEATESPQMASSVKRDKSTKASEKPAEKAAECVTEAAADYSRYYTECMNRIESPAAVSYLKARGISIENALQHYVGFDPAADPASKPGAAADEWKPHPAPRLIIPVNEHFFIGRRTDGGSEYPKINNKGSNAGIFNEQALEKGGIVFVVEGAMDALSITELGEEAIALNSASNADMLVKHLEEKRPAARLVLCADNDKAGQGALGKLKEGLERLELPYIVENISGKYKDANEALCGNREEFSLSIKRAKMAAEQMKPKTDIGAFLERVQGEAYRPFATGLSFFDDLLSGGVIRETLLLLTAAPGAGKTTLAQTMAEKIAENGHRMLYINLEMSTEQMLSKALSMRMTRNGFPIEATTILQGYKWTPEQREHILSAAEEYEQRIRPYIEYRGVSSRSENKISVNIEDILKTIDAEAEKAEAAGQEAPAVVLDYLHLVKSEKKLEVQDLIKTCVYGLKEYAVKHHTFVLAIAAASRNASKGRMGAESGRDSSNLEYTGDYMLSLNYDEVDNGSIDPEKPEGKEALSKEKQEEYRRMILRLDKNRFGQTERYERLYFNARYNTYYGEYEQLPASAEVKRFNKGTSMPGKRF